MKKIIIILMSILSITACSTVKNTPTGAVEEYLSKYQNLNKDVVKELKEAITKEKNMTEKQKKTYQSIIEKQYQNLSYKISNEEVIGNSATVEVEIEVLDYASSINASKKYFEEHQSEFIDKNESTIKEEDIDKASSYIDYKLKKLKEVKDKTKYQIIFELEKENSNWSIHNLNEIDRKKIHGLY